jgi:hypothetical protein
MAILWVDEELPSDRGGGTSTRGEAISYELFSAISRALGTLPGAPEGHRRSDTHGTSAVRPNSQTERYHEHR